MEEKDLKRYYNTQLVIWASLVASVIIYLVIGRFVLYEEIVSREPADVEVLRYVFAAIGIGAPMINIALMKLVLASDRWDGASGVSSLTPFGINNIAAGSVNEMVGVFGLVLFVMAGDEFDLYAFVALSLTYHFIFMPKYSVLKKWAEHTRK